MTISFSDLSFERPTKESIALAFQRVNALLDDGKRVKAIKAWDHIRREYSDWCSLGGIRFAKDVTDQQACADDDYAKEIGPLQTDANFAFVRRLLSDPDRAGLEAIVSAHVVRSWEINLTTYDPIIADDMKAIEKLTRRYQTLTSEASFPIQGKMANISAAIGYAQDSNQDLRHEAEKARWQWFAENGAELDDTFHQQVKRRHGMAVKLGYASFTELGYNQMNKGYTQADSVQFRDAIHKHIVPLVSRILEDRRKEAGWNKLYKWDELLFDAKRNPRPIENYDLFMDQAKIMFRNVDQEIGDFFALMVDGGFVDLQNRQNKRGGGFCDGFVTLGIPFILSNFTGAMKDVGTLPHEVGHAYQFWKSRHLPLIDVIWPTMDVAEIHSKTMEYLCYPHVDPLLMPGDGDLYRRTHLISSIYVLPYIACVDHFQHEVYAKPEATPAERHAMWQSLEGHYMPWRDNGDLAYPAMGGMWQGQPHIYKSPFYYLDYAIDTMVGLQFKQLAKGDYKGTIDRYKTLCALGGSAPLNEIVRDAGLVSPFDPNLIASIAKDVEAELGMASPFGGRPIPTSTASTLRR